MSSKDYMTVAQAAEYLGVTPGRIRQLYKNGGLVGWKPSKQVLLINRRAVETFVRQPRGRRWPKSHKKKS